MAYYPSPRNDDEIFNPSNFPSSNPLSNLGQFALLYPTAQGAITFTDTIAGVLNVLEIGAGGIEYNGVNVSFEKIAAIQAVTSATNSTTLNINNALTIQNGETSLPPTTSMTLGSASGNLTMLLNDGGTSSYGTVGQVLTSGGSGGSLTWTTVTGGGGDDLNDVLGYGNTTSQSAIFNNATVGSATTTITNGGVGIAIGSAINTVSVTGISVISGLEQTSYEADGIEYIVSTGGLPTQKTIIDDVIALQGFTAGTLTSTVGIQKNGAGLQLNTNGTLTLNGLGGSSGQFLKQNSTGNAVWDTVSTNLTNVLSNGNTTLLTAIFNNATAGSPTTSVNNTGLIISSTSGGVTTLNELLNNTTTLVSGVKRIKSDTTTTANIRIDNDTSAANPTFSRLNHDTLTFNFGASGASNVGVEKVSSGLQLNTNGTLTLNGLSGSNGQVLSYSGGNAIWATSTQRGETAVTSMNATSGTVTYASTFATKPYVVLTFNNNGILVFIPIGVLSHQQNVALAYTGFTWTSAATSATATITWYAM